MTRAVVVGATNANLNSFPAQPARVTVRQWRRSNGYCILFFFCKKYLVANSRLVLDTFSVEGGNAFLSKLLVWITHLTGRRNPSPPSSGSPTLHASEPTPRIFAADLNRLPCRVLYTRNFNLCRSLLASLQIKSFRPSTAPSPNFERESLHSTWRVDC